MTIRLIVLTGEKATKYGKYLFCTLQRLRVGFALVRMKMRMWQNERRMAG